MGGASFFTGLSGLKANSQGLNVVGDNLANANTIGYKAKNAFFFELQSASSLDLQAGQGLKDSIQQVWTQGNIQQSRVATDLAVSGPGFFVVGDEQGSLFYTRDGSFHLDRQGFLVTANDLQVLGYPVVNGKVDQSSKIAPLQLGAGAVLEPNATELIRLTLNLDATAEVGDAFLTSVVVYDSLGDSHAVSTEFTKTATGEWGYDMTVPAEDLGGLPTDPPVSISSGTLTFDSKGQLTSPTSDITGITISGLVNGADDIVFDWGLIGAGGQGEVSQVSLPSATAQTFQDGNGAGNLTSILVRNDGVIEGLFSSGFSAPLGQIVLASFANNQGLVRAQDNVYANTSFSGEPNIGAAITAGRGAIIGGALENSNVDIAEEFIKLILFQRAYQANSRMITTADEVTQETIQLKR